MRHTGLLRPPSGVSRSHLLTCNSGASAERALAKKNMC